MTNKEKEKSAEDALDAKKSVEPKKAVQQDNSSNKNLNNKTSDDKATRNPFIIVITFIRQIIDEMKKVTTPTKDELKEYSIVVLVFVLVIMLFITGVDFLIGKGIMALFAK